MVQYLQEVSKKQQQEALRVQQENAQRFQDFWVAARKGTLEDITRLYEFTYKPLSYNALLRDEYGRTPYCSYLKSECGEILLDGLPMDSEVSNKSVALEKIVRPSPFLGA